MQDFIRLMFDCFKYQTYVPIFDIIFDIFLEAQPIVFLVNKLFYFINFKITCKKVIVMSANRIEMDDLWYIIKTLMRKNSIKVFSTFLQFFSFDFFGPKVDFL